MSVNFELLAQTHAKLCLFKVQKSDASIRPNAVTYGNLMFLLLLFILLKFSSI